MSLRTPLAKVKHLGSSGTGTDHYIHQRVSAVFMLPLLIWFILTVICFLTKPLDQIPIMLASGFNIFAAIMFIGVFLFHASLGIRVVLEDYIHCRFMLNLLLGLMYFICWASLIAGVCAVFSMHIISRIMF